MSAPRGLVVDWGGVLTAPLDRAMAQWASGEGVEFGHFTAVLQAWAGPEIISPVQQLERGEITTTAFEQILADELARRGSTVDATGLLDRVLGGLKPLDTSMIGLVRRARAAGVTTALLSNSWGEHYPDELWDGLFDAVVISGRVGMRKPERRIFEYTAGALGLAPQQCVMVDDLPLNVRAAVDAGMVAVQHRTYEQTAEQLEALFGVSLR